MSLVLSGDIGAMGLLYEKYKKPLYSYFLKSTCGDSHSSEDLVHTVFYRAIRYRSTFTGHGSFAKWLFSIAHNSCIDFQNKRKIQVVYKADLFQFESLQSDDDEHERKEMLAILESAMRELSVDERELIILCKIECLKYSDVAEIIGITEGNVKIRMFRALRELRRIYLKLEKCRYEKTGSKGKGR